VLEGDGSYTYSAGNYVAWGEETVASGGQAETYDSTPTPLWTNVTNRNLSYQWHSAWQLLVQGATAKFGTAGSEEVTLDADGVQVEVGATLQDINSYRFVDSIGNVVGRLGGDKDATGHSLWLEARQMTAQNASAYLQADAAENYQAGVYLYAQSSGVGSTVFGLVYDADGDQHGYITQDLRCYKGLYVGANTDPPDDCIVAVADGRFGQGVYVGATDVDPVSPLHVYENTANVGDDAGLTIEQDGAGDAIIQLLLTG